LSFGYANKNLLPSRFVPRPVIEFDASPQFAVWQPEILGNSTGIPRNLLSGFGALFPTMFASMPQDQYGIEDQPLFTDIIEAFFGDPPWRHIWTQNYATLRPFPGFHVSDNVEFQDEATSGLDGPALIGPDWAAAGFAFEEGVRVVGTASNDGAYSALGLVNPTTMVLAPTTKPFYGKDLVNEGPVACIVHQIMGQNCFIFDPVDGAEYTVESAYRRVGEEIEISAPAPLAAGFTIHALTAATSPSGAAETIDGAASLVLPPGTKTVKLRSTGAEWRVTAID
jgi:hypothetical protein